MVYPLTPVEDAGLGAGDANDPCTIIQGFWAESAFISSGFVTGAWGLGVLQLRD